MIAADPVSTCRFINNKYQAIYEFISSDSQPLGPVFAFAANVEYQGRGLQHSHGEVWVERAPVIGESSEEEISEFISKHVTCPIPDSTLCPTLYERVMTFQQHKCNDYYLRTKKTKKGLIKVCRFGYPRPLCDNFILRNVVDAVAGRKAFKAICHLYDLPRRANETRIND